MFTIKTFEFNDFAVNTYVLSSLENECIIIDPGFYTQTENKIFDDYLEENHLTPVKLLITHCHIDHILGIAHLEDKYGLSATIHPKGAELLRASVGYGSVFGFDVERVIKAGGFVSDGDVVRLGHNKLNVVYTPGHAEGSVCYVCHKDEFVVTGDVLFLASIGRTDLPSGNYEVLMNSIKEKLFTLDDHYKVYPGHGDPTTIGHERMTNPYIDLRF